MLVKKIMAAALASALVLSSFTVPVATEAKTAQVKYDPTDAKNKGVYIDTSAVPTSNPSDIKIDNGVIVAKRNVKFRLFCSVDCRWEVEAQGDSNKESVTNGLISVDKAGIVRIDSATQGGNYTVKAIAENVEVEKSASIEIKVKGDEDAAKVKDVIYDKDAITNPQMSVSADGKTMTIDGYVYREEIPVKFSPEYINNTLVEFDQPQSQSYELEGRNPATKRYNSMITTKAKTGSEPSSVVCKVGEGSTMYTCQDLKLVIKNVDFKYQLEASEKESSNQTYTLQKDQYATFHISSNEDITLPHQGIEDIDFKLTQNDVELVPTGSGNAERYSIKDSAGNEFARINVYPFGVEVFTASKGDFKSVEAVNVNYVIHGDTDDAGNNASNHFTIKFNPDTTASFTSAGLDFAATGCVIDRDYTVKKERLGSKEEDVYYFESNGYNLNLADCTVSNVPGVASFVTSKQQAFASDSDAVYKIKYEIKDLDDEVFGSAAAAKKYNNSELGKGEVGSDDVLKDNTKLTLKGIGYKKIVVQCSKGTDLVSKEEYIVRIVSPSNFVGNSRQYKISKSTGVWYDLAADETVHVRMGEAIAPGFYKYEDQSGVYKAADSINDFNPYIEYSVSNPSVASAFVDSSVEQYKINGDNTGIVTVTATGTVNKANTQTFTLYVNKDVMASEFRLSFSEAISSGKVSSDNVVLGKQDKVPVSVTSSLLGAGIPQGLTWTISDKTGEFAVIDSKTGVISTKKSCDEPITVTAEDKNGNKDTIVFTIGRVEAKSITAVGVKESDSEFQKVTDTSGTCKVGNKFTLKAEKYDPINATDVLGKSKWESTNENVVVVDQNGNVKAVGEGQAKIKLTYTSAGKSTETEYTITVSGFSNPVSSIVANDIVLTRIGDTRDIAAKVLPENAADKTLTYTSSNDAIVSVSSAGIVTGNAIGSATITIKSVASNVTKTIKVTVAGQSDISPSTNNNNNTTTNNTNKKNTTKKATVKATKIKSAKNKKGKKIVIKLKKVAGAKYEVSYSLNKKFKKAKKTTSKKASVTLKKLKKKNVYFIKVRAFKVVNGKKVYSKFTAVKKVKVKK